MERKPQGKKRKDQLMEKKKICDNTKFLLYYAIKVNDNQQCSQLTTLTFLNYYPLFFKDWRHLHVLIMTRSGVIYLNSL